MTDPKKPAHETEAGLAGEARRALDQPPRQDRDRWEGFSIEDVRKTRIEAPAPETPANDED